MELKDKFIGFIDILGFKDLITKAESGAGITNVEILQLVQLLSGDRTRSSDEKYGPNICPQSRAIRRDLDFVVTQIRWLKKRATSAQINMRSPATAAMFAGCESRLRPSPRDRSRSGGGFFQRPRPRRQVGRERKPDSLGRNVSLATAS
jgi:hypothetical protein